MNNLENSVGKFIREQQLLLKDATHLVAVSGGADSVALLLILQQMGFHIEAVHCNFHLRGEESDRDETFVGQLCQDRGIHLHLIHFDTNEYASIHKVSIEMAARELRYCYFEQLRQDIGAQTVCVAHHQDDAIETLLMNLLRGAGIHGLTGIRPRNGHIVRPLLCVSRNDIEEYLHSIGQSYITDSSNLKTDVLRNRLRLQVMPMLRQLNPSASENMMRTSLYLSEAEKVYNAEIARELHDVGGECLLSTVKASTSPLCLLHEWLTPYGFNRIQTEQLLACIADGQASGREFLSNSHVLLIDRNKLILQPIQEPMKPIKIPESGTYRLDDNSCLLVEYNGGEIEVSTQSNVATLDAAQISFPLVIRTVQEGDRFQPLGMTGQKLVSDFLTDLKMNMFDKRRQLVVTDASGSILWLVGLRPDHRFRITATTKKVLRLWHRQTLSLP